MGNPQPSRTPPATLVDRWLESFNRHDEVAFTECYSVAGVLEDVALGRFFKGRVELAEFMTVWVAACPDTRVELEKVLFTEQGAAVAWTGFGTLTGDFPHLPPNAVRGSRIEQRGLSLMEFDDDGLIKHQTDYWDFFTVLRQIGLIPE
jgi:steroid delta-isomerase-like uncharacterized protein